jgi:MscS family membrane protein
MDLIESTGSVFALPAQSLYVAKDGGLDENKAREAAQAIQRMREQGELPFPDHVPERISRLENTLEYPPIGSVFRGKKEGS